MCLGVPEERIAAPATPLRATLGEVINRGGR